MSDLVQLNLLVEKYVADETIRKGLAEVALRRTDAKFREIVKCRVCGDLPEQSKAVQNAISQFSLFQNGQSTDIGKIRDIANSINQVAKNTNRQVTAISRVAKDLSVQVDTILNTGNKLKSLSWLNAGLSLANIAVDVAGFVIIGNKLNELCHEMQSTRTDIQQLKDDKIIEKYSIFQLLTRKYNQIVDQIQNYETVDYKVIEVLIMEIEQFLTIILDNAKGLLNFEDVLSMITTLLPAYSVLIKEWLRRYYYAYRKTPSSYNDYIHRYETLINPEFMKRLQDYYFIDKKMGYLDTLDVISAYTFLVLNGKTEVEDQLAILEALSSKKAEVDEYEATVERFQKEVQSFAQHQADKAMMSIEGKTITMKS